MREPHIILTMNHEEKLIDNTTFEMEDIAVCDEEGCLRIFDSFDDARDYQEEHTISGRVVELPTY